MNVQQLRYLVAVLDEGSMSGAARALHVSQPVISRSIKAFEREHSVTLFRLAGRRMVPTGPGAAVISSARQALQAIDAVSEAAAASRSKIQVRICATPTCGALLGLALQGIAGAIPELEVRMFRAGEPAEVLDMVERGQAELGFGVAEDLGSRRGFTVVVVGSAEAVLVSPVGSGLPEKVTWADLATFPLVVPPSASTRRIIIEQQIKAQSGTGSHPALVSDDRTSWISAAQAGIGSFISYRPVAEGLAGVEVRPFEEPNRAPLGFVHAEGRPAAAAARLIQLVRDSPVVTAR